MRLHQPQLCRSFQNSILGSFSSSENFWCIRYSSGRSVAIWCIHIDTTLEIIDGGWSSQVAESISIILMIRHCCCLWDSHFLLGNNNNTVILSATILMTYNLFIIFVSVLNIVVQTLRSVKLSKAVRAQLFLLRSNLSWAKYLPLIV